MDVMFYEVFKEEERLLRVAEVDDLHDVRVMELHPDPRLVEERLAELRRRVLGAVPLHPLQALGVEPHETAMVGDSYEDDIEGARALGIRAVLLDRDGRHPDVDGRIDTLSFKPVARLGYSEYTTTDNVWRMPRPDNPRYQ